MCHNVGIFRGVLLDRVFIMSVSFAHEFACQLYVTYWDSIDVIFDVYRDESVKNAVVVRNKNSVQVLGFVGQTVV